ncbi:MAG: UDP-glucose 4-epimerase GalE [Melioribacteraceae bacterium]|nr:UDP-glucose 4-epimerase GalE [Melioribacteraceae bacterium]MCF8355963.1 UDP-glucose 4-epimerase GalE [Melioribacteraceae bacterium]MCF8395496.1 UDP-glucose 4-epimerase GalE [Melioribacteraceae bacterium]MCF8420836.1 UDP-glucose 4-epimerase GalE [Melioribacteraceae bacterium]
MEKLNILVTGGAGYIGSHVVHDLCDQNFNVIILDNFSLGQRVNVDERAKLIEGDILVDDDLNTAFENKIDVVFHFAAWKAAGESMVDPSKYAKNNICGTLNLLNKMVENNTNYFIFSSSAAVYGSPQYLPIDENHPVNPENYYGYTKLAIEENLNWFSKLKGIKYAALRYFNATGYDIKGRIKGKERNPANLCPIVMEAAAGIRSKIQVFGDDYSTPDGTCIRDYIHVNDLSTAHLKAMNYIMKNKESLLVNLGTGKGQSVFEMINTAEKAVNRKISYDVVGRRAGDPAELIASSQKALDLLNWKAEYSDIETIFKSMAKVYL